MKITLHDGRVLRDIHSEEGCSARWNATGHCAIHKPSDHPLRDAPFGWHNLIRHLTRVCEHGLEHPDPDDLAFKKAMLDWITVEAIASFHLVEGNCDGCCRA